MKVRGDPSRWLASRRWRDPILRDRAFWLRFLDFAWWDLTHRQFRLLRNSWLSAHSVTSTWPGMRNYDGSFYRKDWQR